MVASGVVDEVVGVDFWSSSPARESVCSVVVCLVVFADSGEVLIGPGGTSFT